MVKPALALSRIIVPRYKRAGSKLPLAVINGSWRSISTVTIGLGTMGTLLIYGKGLMGDLRTGFKKGWDLNY